MARRDCFGFEEHGRQSTRAKSASSDPFGVTTLIEPIVIGVDGGGTHLRVVVATGKGEVLGVGRAGSGNYHNVGADQVRSNLELALTQAWTESQLPPQQADAVFLGLGSVTTDEDRATIRDIVREVTLMPRDCIGVDHDLRIALAGGLAGSAGIVLIAGTGSSCYGRNEEGRSWICGGWGHILDDVGGSYWMGLQAVIAATRDFDGRSESTCLRARVAEYLGCVDIRQIMRRVDFEGLTRSEMAALARLTTEAASEGDSVACRIVDHGTDELATLVATVVTKLDLANSIGANSINQIPVTVTGGLTNAGAVFMGPLEKAIKNRVSQVEVVTPRLPPVLGAIMLAIESLGEVVTSRVLNNLTVGNAAKSHP
jgi:glucosamine kinase